ncbi:cysteine dioxygenase type I [Colletotrichum sublineola]|uniref:Cysteine dioxygenase n=1 Tax=Colletotrichum sublineola TaxID=1173701 RepID=A0A066X4N8_COLSU|nr:cysteine dioxygenase type I [Colletotrichum sublineola]KDN60671.1 putative cysteine dioxygenase [Colletotrichum sublineola]
MNKFEGLVIALRDALGASGLTCDSVDLDFLKRLMKDYDSNEAEWGSLALADPSRAYTRNLVDEGNGKSNLLILVWTPGKSSPIHSHSNAHCLMKILKGELTETRYDFPQLHKSQDSFVSKSGGGQMDVVVESTYTANEVAYMSDDLGVHKVWNKGDDFAVSLHLYTPPNIARDGCYIFDAGTGKGTLSKNCDFYSIRGSLVKPADEKGLR